MELGKLSERYEAGASGTAAVGWDSRGGASYGRYQIAFNPGTLRAFMDFLKIYDTKLHDALAEHWDTAGDKRGAFARTWKSLARGQATRLGIAEHSFIRSTHYDPALMKLRRDVQARVNASATLQQVLWSAAVQHGPLGAATIFNGVDPAVLDNGAFIVAIYKKRSRRLSRLTPRERQAVLRRYDFECAEALNLLASENRCANAVRGEEKNE